MSAFKLVKVASIPVSIILGCPQLLFRPVLNISSQAVNTAVLVFLFTFGFMLPFNTDGVVFFVIGNDFNTVVLCDAAVFFAQPTDTLEYFHVVFEGPFFVQTGIEFVECFFQANPSTGSGQAWKRADGLFFFGFLIGKTMSRVSPVSVSIAR